MAISDITRAEWISAASVVISLFAAGFTWKNLRLSARKEQREIAASLPIIQHRLLDEDVPGWITVEITVKNRHPHNLAVSKLRLAAPRDGGIGVLNRAEVKPAGEFIAGKYRWDLIEVTKREFAPWGDPMRAAGHSEATKAIRFVLKARAKAATYSIELSFEERLAEIRRSTTMLKISVPAEIASANKATMS